MVYTSAMIIINYRC